MKRIITVMLGLSCVHAAPYVGAKVGFSRINTDTKFTGTDLTAPVAAPFTYNVNEMRYHAVNFGMFFGYSFNINSKFNAFLEGDYEYLTNSKKKSRININPTPQLAVFKNENVSVRAKHSFGIMPGIEFKAHDKISILAGVRLNWTQYEVRGHHVNADGVTINPLNDKKSRSFIMGVEPTLGTKFKFNDKLSARLTVGYNIGQSKKIVSNYMGTAGAITQNVTSGITIKPRSINVRAALIYSF